MLHLTPEQIAAYRDRELRDPAVERHVANCQECRAQVAGARLLSLLLAQSLEAPVEQNHTGDSAPEGRQGSATIVERMKSRGLPLPQTRDPLSGSELKSDLKQEKQARRRPARRDLDHPPAETLAAYSDGGLSLRGASRVESHLRQCEQCAGEILWLRSVVETPPGEAPPRGLVARLVQQVGGLPQARSLGRILVEQLSFPTLRLTFQPSMAPAGSPAFGFLKVQPQAAATAARPLSPPGAPPAHPSSTAARFQRLSERSRFYLEEETIVLSEEQPESLDLSFQSSPDPGERGPEQSATSLYRVRSFTSEIFASLSLADQEIDTEGAGSDSSLVSQAAAALPAVPPPMAPGSGPPTPTPEAGAAPPEGQARAAASAESPATPIPPSTAPPRKQLEAEPPPLQVEAGSFLLTITGERTGKGAVLRILAQETASRRPAAGVGFQVVTAGGKPLSARTNARGEVRLSLLKGQSRLVLQTPQPWEISVEFV